MSLPEMLLPLPRVSAEGEASFPDLLATGLSQLHRAGGGSSVDADAIARAARGVGEAILEGRISVALSELGGGKKLEQALSRSPVVAIAKASKPLVLDGEHLYLARYWDYQTRFNQVLKTLNQPAGGVDAKRLRIELDRLFAPAADGATNWQKVAAATGVLRRLCVISGGPGTGKTSTVVRILAILLTLDPTLRIAIAAPTGKAAARVQESIRQQMKELKLPSAVAAGMPGESHTLHRLLGYQHGRVGFRHDRNNPLPHDVVVVDEASMLDLALAAKLAESIKDGARLILLGDKDQLSSVEAGAVYAGVSTSRAVSEDWAAQLSQASGETVTATGNVDAALADAVTWLERSYRFAEGSALGQLARAINDGDATSVTALLTAGGNELEWTQTLPAPGALASSLADGFSGYIAAIRDHKPVTEVFAAFDRYRVLCSTREGRYGSRPLGALLIEELRSRLRASPGEHWFAGRPVLVTRNDYTLNLYNGDVGIVLPGADGELRVHFLGSDGGVRELSPHRLDATEDAMAVTVHRAQGSEFDRVALVIDPQATRGLSRSLVYTGVTRARSGVQLFCEAATQAASVK